jgi:hypothetical protein
MRPNATTRFRNAKLKKHLLMMFVFAALWVLWVIGLLPDATARLY